ncbi:hypothetical protein WJX75_007369 [Coccomyxa subellipsoidea]|uniref:Uncharacterized protein n=1 Tax=Coccomyxa subellipsoidea TaxID=248742 RepID=A0ABR2YI45_9CHLO
MQQLRHWKAVQLKWRWMATLSSSTTFAAFDEAIRGLPLGSTTVLEAKGGDWNRELFFEVPRDHAEIQRLEGSDR